MKIIPMPTKLNVSFFSFTSVECLL